MLSVSHEYALSKRTQLNVSAIALRNQKNGRYNFWNGSLSGGPQLPALQMVAASASTLDPLEVPTCHHPAMGISTSCFTSNVDAAHVATSTGADGAGQPAGVVQISHGLAFLTYPNAPTSCRESPSHVHHSTSSFPYRS